MNVKQLFFVLIFLPLTASAQKDSIFTSAEFHYFSLKEDFVGSKSKSTNYGFTPKIGYGIAENWILGIRFGYNIQKLDNENTYFSRLIQEISAGPFIRYTKNLSPLFTVYGDLASGYQYKKIDVNSDTIPSHASGGGVFAQIYPGVGLRVTKTVALNFNVGGITYSSYDLDDDTGQKALGVTFGSEYRIGITKTF